LYMYIYIYTIGQNTNDSCGRAAIGQLWIVRYEWYAVV